MMLEKIGNRRNFYTEIIFDIILFGVSFFLAFYVRFDGSIPADSVHVFKDTISIIILLRIIFSFIFKVFSGHWHYAGFNDLFSILLANTAATLTFAGINYLQTKFVTFPQSVFIIDWMLSILLVGGIRYSKRFIKETLVRKGIEKRVLIIGAGQVGTNLINYMRINWELGYKPVAFVDDDPQKINQTIYGIKVLGSHKSIPHLVEEKKIDEIIIAINNASSEKMRHIVSMCRLAGVPFKTTANPSSNLSQQDLSNRIRNIKIEDLIGRKPIEIDFDEIRHFIHGKRVLVTGAAGSIGSELCRQIAEFRPEKLIAFDRSENGLFYLNREFQEKYLDLDMALALSDITDFHESNRVLEKYKPHLVFHAAAYKHVYMMELNPHQAIKNNIIGTRNILESSLKNNVEKFIFISTDKAVNPTNIMGISKRIAEQYVQAYNQKNGTRCVAVRFGNVIGSSGSVIRIFQEQIASGHPITITHPDVKRFFMTIPEAVQLVLQAANKGNGGEIFVLKMGELIKIMDVAKELILLAGKQPDKDVKIEITGLRPGEKMIEELWEDSEQCKEDFNENLYIIRNGAIKNIDKYEKNLNDIISKSRNSNNNTYSLRQELESAVKFDR